MPSSPDPLLSLIRRVRVRCVLAEASWMFVMAGFVVAVAFVVMSITLRLVPMTIGSTTAAIAIVSAIAVAVMVGVVRRWPSEARIARRIDQALELRELLATGFASTGDDPAARSVRASAVERARGIRPGDVPLSVPSANSITAAVLVLIAVVMVNALIQPMANEGVTTIKPTRPNRTPAGLMDHDAAAVRGAQRASVQEPEPESTHAPMPTESPMPATTAAGSGDASDGRTDDGDGRDRGTSVSTAGAETDLTFSVSSGAKNDAAPGEMNPGATGGAGTEAGANPSANDMRAGASSPRIPERGRSGSQHSNVNTSSPSRAIARIPDRHRDLVRAYFDAAATQPSDAKR